MHQLQGPFQLWVLRVSALLQHGAGASNRLLKRLCQAIWSRERPKEIVGQCSIEAAIYFGIRGGLSRAAP